MVGRLSACILLAALLGFAGTAQAQPSDQDPVDQPRPLLSATATCHTDTAEIQVIVHDDRNAPFTVHLTGPRFSDKRTTTLDTKHFVHVVDFSGLAAGEYDISTETFDSPADGIHVKVQNCAPSKEPLSVELECKAGWGTATFRVANPNADKQVRYTLTIDGLPAHIISLNPNTFVRITENGYEDRRHTAAISGANVTRTFTVACQSGNPPALDLTTSACDGGTAHITATLLNPNGLPASYTVELNGSKKTVKLGGGEHTAVTFPGLQPATTQSRSPARTRPRRPPPPPSTAARPRRRRPPAPPRPPRPRHRRAARAAASPAPVWSSPAWSAWLCSRSGWAARC